MGIEELKLVDEWVEPKDGSLCLVECFGYCPSGFFVAKFTHGKYVTDLDEDITEYVTSYLEINV